MQKQDSPHQYTNHLIHESSPYLQQHAHNPVNWYPWGEKTLKRAQEENKLLIISIGYSSCHWCHVMEHESFEDEEVAEIMNSDYISIKVDREERPDLDQIYMDAAQLIIGRGGWPLNAIALPDGRPVFAGTYFPKENWLTVLEYFAGLKKNNPERLRSQAEKITSHIRQLDNLPPVSTDTQFNPTELEKYLVSIKKKIDKQYGGLDSAPKFPMPTLWEFLLAYASLQGDITLKHDVNRTFTAMADGGIYDHIGGGFARYSTDTQWHVPHFEKMLYDNAQLIKLYTHAWQATKDEKYKQVVYESCNFIKEEFTSEEYGFYTALDADSEGEEGKFYVWTAEEIDSCLGEEGEIFKTYYGITEAGNWENGKNILSINKSVSQLSQMYDKTESEIRTSLGKSRSTLLKIRNKRERPGLDDKQVTAWNAMMISALAEAYRAFDESKFLNLALKNAEFILSHLTEGKELLRSYKNGKAKISGFLDDYAFTIEAFLKLYEATFERKWLKKAGELTEVSLEHFYDIEKRMFYYVHAYKAQLIARKTEYMDNVIPSSNALMAHNLRELGLLFLKDNYCEISDKMLGLMLPNIEKNPIYFHHWAALYHKKVSPAYELAIVGKDCHDRNRELGRFYLPNVLFLGTEKEEHLPLLKHKYREGKTLLYLCQEGSCMEPVERIEKVVENL